ncbi:MAG TPA: agmatinase [Pseudomonadales bacterium]|jgi:agmatinase
MTRSEHTRSDLLGHRSGMTFAGELSFLRRKYTRDIEGADLVVTGLPFDMATTFRPGARLGPQAIRAASVQLAGIAGRAFPYGEDPFATLAVADCGDCFIDSGYPQHGAAAIEAHARDIIARGCKLLSFGGDHFVTYPLLRAHAEKHGPMSLIHFDAHVDTWEDDGSRIDHGSMFLRALREGLIVPERSVQIGIRSFSQQDHGFVVCDAPWVHEHGPQAVLERVLSVVGQHPAYLTFDIDCLDPAFAPGTGTPVAGGLSSAQALHIIRGLTPVNLVGMDVVEVAPAYDHAELTAIAAATIAHDLICQEALRRG